MAQLPPKIPNQNWPPTIPPNQRMPPLTTTSPPPQQPPPPQPSPTAAASLWADEFLDFSSARRGHHRRSMSDSIAFLESPLIDACRNSLHAGASGFDRLDDEQLMSMFSDDVSGGRDSNNGMVGSPSDQNSNNDENVMSAEYNDGHNGDGDGDGDGERSHWLPKTEVGEVESDCNNNNNNSLSAPSSGNVTPIYSDADPTCFDPKRVKRILANRQSAQRSRVRKLQYISELERSVTSLQTEVSALSPRVAYLDHQRLILNVDNSAIKQRIAALAQDKIFKDAHQEALKKEIERLTQIYHQQQQQHQQTMKLMGNAATQPPSSDHSMDCADKEQLMA